MWHCVESDYRPLPARESVRIVRACVRAAVRAPSLRRRQDSRMNPITRVLLVQAIRYVVALQAFGMVVLHAGWMLLAAATWGDVDGGGDISRLFLRAFVWLGGVDADGHGDEGTVFAAWGKVSVGVWVLDAAWRALRGPRPPWALWKATLLSGAIALAGYAFAMWPSTRGGLGEVSWVLVGFTIATTVSTFWALAARRIGEWVIARIGRSQAMPAQA
jgi:hypothetical protein